MCAEYPISEPALDFVTQVLWRAMTWAEDLLCETTSWNPNVQLLPNEVTIPRHISLGQLARRRSELPARRPLVHRVARSGQRSPSR